MKCPICRNGSTSAGHATITLEHEGTVVVFKEVPAEICEVCGEAYTDTATTDVLLQRTRKAGEQGVEVQVQHYIAA
jgi:YgiT-type zinc finger domain-containing protein